MSVSVVLGKDEECESAVACDEFFKLFCFPVESVLGVELLADGTAFRVLAPLVLYEDTAGACCCWLLCGVALGTSNFAGFFGFE